MRSPDALTHDSGTAAADFDHVEDGEAYIVRVHHVGGEIIAELPLTIWLDEGYVATSEGGRYMEPSYRAGKKFVDGKTIEAKYRLTVYGDDGFTIHTATLWEDGTTSCNCPRWGPKIDGRRRCPHSLRALTLTANVDETGEQPDQAGDRRLSGRTNPFRRRSRSVDT